MSKRDDIDNMSSAELLRHVDFLISSNRPDQLIRLCVSHPERLFSDEFNVAQIDAMAQVNYRPEQVAPGQEAAPEIIPLLNDAIERVGTPIETIRTFADALEATLPGTISALYQVPRGIEPPLFTAVRAGRPEVVRELLTYPGIHGQMRYTMSSTNPSQDECRQVTYAHLPLCGPDTVDTSCMTPAEYAVTCFAADSDRPAHISRRQLEECALVLVNQGFYPGPSYADSSVSRSFMQAIRSGMTDYLIAVLDRMIALPRQNVYRQYLIPDGLTRILYFATRFAAADNDRFIEHIINISKSNSFFPLPADPTNNNTNPLAVALEQRRPQNALRICSLLNEGGFPYGDVNDYMMRLMGHPAIEPSLTSDDRNRDFYIMYMRFLQSLIQDSKVPKELNPVIVAALDRLVLLSFQSGKNSQEISTHAVKNGFDTAIWLRVAIQYHHVAAIIAIVSRWTERQQRLEELLPSFGPTPDTQPVPESTALGVAVRLQFISPILVLMNAGADPTRVEPALWRALGDNLERDTFLGAWGNIADRYFSYGITDVPGYMIGSSIPPEAIQHRIKAFCRLMVHICDKHGPKSIETETY